MMIPTPLFLGTQPPMQAFQSSTSSFWLADNVHEHITNIQESVDLLKAVQKELEVLEAQSSSNINAQGYGMQGMHLKVFEIINKKGINLDMQKLISLEAAKSLFLTVKNQLLPFISITNQLPPWEERSVAVNLAQKLQKHRRNKRWKKKKRKLVSEMLHKERENYDKAVREADEWRAREIAKGISKQKVENMKAIAKVKANEEKKRLESELELVLVVEKLQELRSMRIQKLKKQGHFLPEEDDKFLEQVRVAVEEEERQAAAAAEMDSAKGAIATAEGSRKVNQDTRTEMKDCNGDKGNATTTEDQLNGIQSERSLGVDTNMDSACEEIERHGQSQGYDSVVNLPFEFYHYYHGSSNDMGTLIEVRRMWDAYIRPGGSRIPGHWVQPPPPADEVWASYIVGTK